MIRINNEWNDYEIIRTGDGYKLEMYSQKYKFLRPDPQVIWKADPSFDFERECDAFYSRNNDGGGLWTSNNQIPEEFFVHWRELTFSLKLMGFKHTGIFPEQAYNWARIIDTIKNSQSNNPSVLNLFAYTGGATAACLLAGASVCHVDAAKSMCERAKRNLNLSGLGLNKVRFIVDDCIKFVEREGNRGKKYDAIIMDPPSFGRGPKGETWKITDQIYELVQKTKKLLSEKPLFFLVNSYTTGLQPTSMKVILDKIYKDIPHDCEAYEIGIQTKEKEVVLPCGASAFMVFK